MKPNKKAIADGLKKTFADFANEHAADVSGRILRTVLTGGKAALDQGAKEFSRTYVQDAVQGVYDLIGSEKVANLLATGGKTQKEQTEKLVSGLFSRLQDPATVLKATKLLQPVVKQVPMKVVDEAVTTVLSQFPQQEQQVYATLYMQFLRPLINDARSSNPEMLAQQISFMAMLLPTDQIASALTQQLTKDQLSAAEIIAKQKEVLEDLPNARTVAHIVHEAVSMASQCIGEAAKAPSTKEVLQALKNTPPMVVFAALSAYEGYFDIKLAPPSAKPPEAPRAPKKGRRGPKQ